MEGVCKEARYEKEFSDREKEFGFIDVACRLVLRLGNPYKASDRSGRRAPR
jgi:hypothetical protein